MNHFSHSLFKFWASSVNEILVQSKEKKIGPSLLPLSWLLTVAPRGEQDPFIWIPNVNLFRRFWATRVNYQIESTSRKFSDGAVRIGTWAYEFVSTQYFYTGYLLDWTNWNKLLLQVDVFMCINSEVFIWNSIKATSQIFQIPCNYDCHHWLICDMGNSWFQHFGTLFIATVNQHTAVLSYIELTPQAIWLLFYKI